jgi:hypothetical protein
MTLFVHMVLQGGSQDAEEPTTIVDNTSPISQPMGVSIEFNMSLIFNVSC